MKPKKYTIKPLFWTYYSHSAGKGYECEMPRGRYVVWKDKKVIGGKWIADLRGVGRIGEYDSANEAQSACQAEHERLVEHLEEVK